MEIREEKRGRKWKKKEEKRRKRFELVKKC